MREKSTLIVKSIAFLSLMLISIAPRLAVAEPMCPAIYPCDDGRVLPDFAAGPCGKHFASICAQEKVNELAEDFIGCQANLSQESARVNELEQMLAKQKKKTKRFKQRLRSSKRKLRARR